MRIVQPGRFPLHDSHIGSAQHADLPVRPGLSRDPVQRVIAVAWFLCQRIESAFGLVPPAHVLDDHAVTVIHKETVVRRQIITFVVRRAHQDHGKPCGIRRKENIRGELHAIPHRNPYVQAFDDFRRGRGLSETTPRKQD